MTVQLTGKWNAANRGLSAIAKGKVIKSSYDQAVEKECHRLRGLMIEAFNNSGPPGYRWPPLSPMTRIINEILGNSHTKPLLVHGDLRNSISVYNEGGNWYVTANRKVRGKGGKLVDLAMVHNYGTRVYTVPVTDKLRRFFMFLHLKSGGRIMPLKASATSLTIRIPARPWIEPIWKREKNRVILNITKGVAGGVWNKVKTFF